VTDLADAHVRALRALLGGADSMALNLGTGRGWSVRELVATVRKVTGRDFPVQFGPRRPGDPPALVADPARAREKLGWRPQHCELATQVAHAWAWHQGGGRTWKRTRALGPTCA
jgi:UDP-glucose 4-epimerase